MSGLFWLSDAQMARLEPFFPKSHGKPPVDNVRIQRGIIFINRSLSEHLLAINSETWRGWRTLRSRTAPVHA